MEAKIQNRTARVLGTCLGHRLLPGKNKIEISDKDFATVLQNDQFRSWQKLGWVVVQGAGAPAATPGEESFEEEQEIAEDALGVVSVSEAKSMVSACSDPALLEAWYNKEKRVTVRKAIEKRIEEVDPNFAGEEEGILSEEDDLPDGVDEVFGE